MIFRNTSENVKYGLSREQTNKSIIEKIFGLNLIHSKYQYQIFDFYDPIKCVLVEHKSFHISFHKSNWTLLKTNKVLNSNSMFIFEFQDNKLFYLQYSSKLFKTFQQDWIKYHNKINKEHFFIIPNKHLTYFDETSEINLEFKSKNIPYISLLIEQDMEQSKLTI